VSRLSEKAKLVADGQKSLASETEAELDAMLAKQAQAKSRKDAAMQKIAAVQADIDGGTAEIENVAAQLSNQ
jgi:hypothetical protein